MMKITREKKGFTLIELVVAIALLAIVITTAGLIFKSGIQAHRIARANAEINAEIMQKFRAITEQLHSDFSGLRKDGEIFMAWVSSDQGDGKYTRYDRVMFYANGDFTSYNEYVGDVYDGVISGNVARISYMLANAQLADGITVVQAGQLDPRERVLSRVQHILTSDSAISDGLDADPDADPFPIINPFNRDDFRYRWDLVEYDNTTDLQSWMNIPLNEKADILSEITGIKIGSSTINDGGTVVDANDPSLSVQNILCKGVGQFRIQGWNDNQKRWIPEEDPDGDGDWTDDSDFFEDSDPSDPNQVPGIWYPYRPNSGIGFIYMNSIKDANDYPLGKLTQQYFNEIPGLGRALKFTFTLYDSKGIIAGGREFTYIVYLNN